MTDLKSILLQVPSLLERLKDKPLTEREWVIVLHLVPYVIFGIGFLIAYFFYRFKVSRILAIQKVKDEISRDLHDHIGSSLSAISLVMPIIESAIVADPEKARNLLAGVGGTTRVIQENLQDIVWGMHSKNDSMSTTLDRMRSFFESMVEGRSVDARLLIDEEVYHLSFSLERRYNIYLVFKELINNGVKYAHAHLINVNVTITGNFLRLTYEDDGIGFNLDDAKEGNGIANMKFRAAALGGNFTIDSATGKGTRAELRLSL